MKIWDSNVYPFFGQFKVFFTTFFCIGRKYTSNCFAQEPELEM